MRYQELLFSASVLGAAIALHNCRHAGVSEYALRTVDFPTRSSATIELTHYPHGMPEWQGAGIGMRFLNAVCAEWRRGRNRYDRPMLTLFHTSHPGLAVALRRDPLWAQVSARLFGESKARSQATLKSSGRGAWQGTGFGGHFRAIQGFRYVEGA